MRFGAFVAVSALLIVTPGPDMALVTRNALRSGWRAASLPGFGIGAGSLVWGLASMVGVGILLEQSAVTFSPETLIDYLVTQTNVIAAVEGGREHLADVRQWLMHSITPLVEDREEAHFLFQGPI
jgi:LysE type translocator